MRPNFCPTCFGTGKVEIRGQIRWVATGEGWRKVRVADCRDCAGTGVTMFIKYEGSRDTNETEK
jgi:hypothetical protein